jgi:hypothetical protein
VVLPDPEGAETMNRLARMNELLILLDILHLLP